MIQPAVGLLQQIFTGVSKTPRYAARRRRERAGRPASSTVGSAISTPQRSERRLGQLLGRLQLPSALPAQSCRRGAATHQLSRAVRLVRVLAAVTTPESLARKRISRAVQPFERTSHQRVNLRAGRSTLSWRACAMQTAAVFAVGCLHSLCTGVGAVVRRHRPDRVLQCRCQWPCRIQRP